MQLYALKVFGCHGATGLIAKAMDWALDPDGDGDFSDRLDVVNLSLGSDYGAPDDPDSLFVRKLALNGVLPVVAAGNGGDLYDIGAAPGNTPEALTVASTRDSAVLRDGAQVTRSSGLTGSNGGQIVGGQYSQDFSGYDRLDRTAPVVRLSDPANADGCQPYSAADAAAVAGKHVWLEWDDDDATRSCGSKARAGHALAAKAAGVLLSSVKEHFAASIAGNVDVPMFQFTGPATAALRPAVAAGTLGVRLAGQLRASVPTADASGRVALTPQDHPGGGVPQDYPGGGVPQDPVPPLRVPVYAAPRPVAAIAAPRSIQFLDHDRQAVLTLSGRGVDQGSADAAYRSLISVLQLQTESVRLPQCTGVVVAGCTPNGTARGGDIRYVGVTSTAPLAVARGRPEDAVLAFGITTWEDWYNVGSNTVPFVDIDTSGDGLPDFEIRGTKLASTDVLVAATVDLHAPAGSPPVQVLPVNGQYGDVDSGVFDSNVIVLPVSLTALRIDPLAATAPISYPTGVASHYPGPVSIGGVIDSTGPALSGAVRPGLWAQGAGGPALSYLARPGTALVVNRDTTAAVAQRATRLLVLHPGNSTGHRVQLVAVSAPGPGL